VISFGWAWSLSGESLWLDELHSSWVISDDWAQVAARARAGNQSPVYFYGLKLTQQFLPGGGWSLNREAALRLPSLLSWSLTIGIFGWLVTRLTSEIYRDCRKAGTAWSIRGEGRFDEEPAQASPLATLDGPGTGRCWAPLVFAAGCCLWLLVDRLQCFYATEARVYAIVQLLGLVTWLMVVSVVGGRRSDGSWISWNLLAPLMLHLHITAALVVCCQWLTLGIFSLTKPRGRCIYLLTSIWLSLHVGLVLRPMGSVWDRRSQWETFAGDTSLTSLRSQFPALAALIPIALFAIIQHLRNPPSGTHPDIPRNPPSGTHPDIPLPEGVEPAGTQQSGSTTREGTQHITAEQAADPMGTQLFAAERSFFAEASIWFWALAALGPIAIAWILTGLGGIPIFHYRFLIGSAIPLYVLLAIVVSRLKGDFARWLGLASVFLWLAVSQGTARHWYQQLTGRGLSRPNIGLSWHLMGGLRGEGWREATEYIAHRIDADSEMIWCSSGLIEARTLHPPLTDSQNEYLTFPLRGIYRITTPSSPVSLAGLVGQSRFWQEQLFGSSIEADGVKAAWIIHRGSAESLRRRLERAGLLEQLSWTENQQFGGVSVTYGRFRGSD
jgi:hypothetical protein